MSRKSIITLIVIMALLVPGFALAQPRPAGSGYGPGSGPVTGPMADFQADQDVIQTRTAIFEKSQQLSALFNQEKLDETKAKQLHGELLTLRNHLAEKRFDYVMKYKKENPEWHPGMFKGRSGRGGRGGFRPGPASAPYSGNMKTQSPANGSY
jgi:hypothetical protein